MNFERLENLIVALDGVAPSEFDMGDYTRCGSPSCVFGHYAASSLQNEFELGEFSVQSIGGRPVYTGNHEMCEHFGLTEDESFELFSGRGCGEAQTPAEARAYIRTFIDRHRAAEASAAP